MKLYKGFKIDHKNSGAVIYKDAKFVKSFASDETKNGKSGLKKAKSFIDNA